MNDKQMEALAEKLGWHVYDSFTGGAPQRYIDSRRSLVRAGRYSDADGFNFTESGAFACIDEFGLGKTIYGPRTLETHPGIDRDYGWIVFGCERDSLLAAVTAAVIEILKQEPPYAHMLDSIEIQEG